MTLDQLIPEHRLAHFRAGAFAWMGWLLEVILRLGPLARSRRLKRFVLRAERWAECVCFLMAVRRFGYLPKRQPRPASTPQGFRRVRGSRRLFLKSAQLRAKGAALSTRLRQVIEALTHPDRYVARFYKRLLHGLRGSRLVATVPPPHALSCAPSQSPARVDSS